MFGSVVYEIQSSLVCHIFQISVVYLKSQQLTARRVRTQTHSILDYTAFKNRWTWQIFDSSFLTSLRSARHRSNNLTHFFVLLSVFLFWLFSLISSKSVASISGNLTEDSIWNSESSKRRTERKVGKFSHYQHKTKPCERWSLADVWKQWW